MLAPASKDTVKDEAYFKSLAEHCNQYKGAQTGRSLAQMSVTLVLFLVAVAAMIGAIQAGNWLVYAALLLPTSGLLVRVFIMQHDCGHGSYFKTRKANTFVGRMLSVLTWTPYSFWRRTHNMHHASSGNLDKRGYGGIETLTVAEFETFSPAKQRFYRFYRNTYLLLGIGTPLLVIVIQRFLVGEPFIPEVSKQANMKGSWKSIYGTNLALVLAYGALGYFVGYGVLTAVYLPILIVTSWAGGWLFYIQHQFEDTHWERQEGWSYNEAALVGRSYYDLPPILQWFTGNIGLHHIHHLNATIPNYKLQECLDGHPDLPTMNRMTLRDSLDSIKLSLWDEAQKKLITFREYDQRQAAAA